MSAAARHEAILVAARREGLGHTRLIALIAAACVASLAITGFFDATIRSETIPPPSRAPGWL